MFRCACKEAKNRPNERYKKHPQGRRKGAHKRKHSVPTAWPFQNGQYLPAAWPYILSTTLHDFIYIYMRLQRSSSIPSFFLFCEFLKIIMKKDVQKMVTIFNQKQKLWLATTMVMLIFLQYGATVGSQRVPAMFVFGDSLVDVGNNNFLNSLAKSNYYPHGCNFRTSNPSGRFSNGKTFADMIGN